MANRQSETAELPVTALERWIVIAVVVAAFGLRIWNFELAAVEHFDEGVYASNVWFGPEQDFQYPNRELYAPPLLPFLIEWSIVLLGPIDLAALLPSILAGSLLPLVLWRTARDAFGPAAGLFAAIAGAGQSSLIIYSRTALTDMLLTTLVVTAVWLFARSVRREKLGLAVAAGAVTALAWWTKYNGWLPLFLTAAGAGVWWLAARPDRKSLLLVGQHWLMQTATAALLWAPYLMDLQRSGGYARIAANHRQYIVGFSGWFESLQQQIDNHAALDGWVSWLFVGLGIVVAMAARQHGQNHIHDAKWRRYVRLVGVLLVVALAPLGPVSLLAISLLAVAAIASQIRWGAKADELFLPLTLHVATLAMFVMTPLYTPYPRLTLPFVVLAILSAAGLFTVSRETERIHDPQPEAASGRSPLLKPNSTSGYLLLLFVVMLIAAGVRYSISESATWGDRTQLKAACRQAAELIIERHDADGAIVYVIGEPAAFFQLRAAGLPLVGPVQDFTFAAREETNSPLPLYVLTGPHAAESAELKQQIAALGDRLTLEQETPYVPSRLVRLNLTGNIERENPAYVVRLWRVGR